MKTTSLYYIADAAGAEPRGPYTVTQIRNMWNSGSITAAAFIVAEGGSDWLTLREAAGLFEDPAPAVVTVAVTREDPFAALHTPIRGKSPGVLTPIGWAGIVIGILSTPFLLAGGAGLPGVLMGVACYLWCRKPIKEAQRVE